MFHRYGMRGFKDYIDAPALVRHASGDTVRDLRGMRGAVDAAFGFLRKLAGSFGSFRESSSFVKDEVNRHVIGSREFRDHMKSNFNATPLTANFGYQHSCGKDGCAYFFSNKIVVKFSQDANEMRIAESVAGMLKRLPVVAAFEIELEAKGSVLYAIVMRELERIQYNMNEAYTEAYQIFTGVLDGLMDLVERRDVPVEYIRKRLSLAYMTRSGVSPKVVPYLEDLVRAVRAIYVKSGHLLGADWSDRNLGFTNKGRVQPFDFGRSIRHDAAFEKVPAVERKTVVIKGKS